MNSLDAKPTAKGHSLLRLMLMGLLSGIISAAITTLVIQVLSETKVFGTVTGVSATNSADDLATAFIAAFLWFLPVGIIIFPPAAKFLGAASGTGTLRRLKLAGLGVIIWAALAEAIYLLLSPLAPPPPGAQLNDLISAGLSGILFAIVYDLLLRRRDYLLTPFHR